MDKIYTKPNELQLEIRDQCVVNAKQYLHKDQDLKIINVTLWDFNGTYAFTMSVEAKPNTGMLGMLNQLFSVHITKRGAVQSSTTGIHTNKGFKRNKHLIFI